MTTFQAIVAIFGMLTASITAIWTTIQITDYLRKQREKRQSAQQEQTPPAGQTGPVEQSPPASPPPAPAPSPGNLPRQLTSFIGRERERGDVARLLASTRLLTLTGPGGTGKTRLSVQVATRVLDEFRDGAFFVALSAISDPDLLVSSIAHVVGVKESGDTPLPDLLKQHLRDRQVLLVLDNFEQLLAAAPVITELLAAAPRLKALVTSRAVLRLHGENEYPVPPLALPDLDDLPPRASLMSYSAVALFLQRARAARPGFELTDENARAVAEVCVRLDGLPLAIELAAARIKLLSPQAMLARLKDRFKLLTGGARDLPARQQTMRGAIAWGYDLLEEGEQRLFRYLSSFVGGFTLEAAEAVCEGAGGGDIDILDGVSSLVDKSLLRQRELPDGEPRFTMLANIREFAAEQIATCGEAESLAKRHTQYFLDAVVRVIKAQVRSVQRSMAHHAEEVDNLRAALR